MLQIVLAGIAHSNVIMIIGSFFKLIKFCGKYLIPKMLIGITVSNDGL